MDVGRILKILFCAGGIYLAYLTQGIVSERLALDSFGDGDGLRFEHMSGLPWFQSLACFVVGFVLLKLQGTGKADQETHGVPPVSAYWKAALTASVGPALGIMSLKNISYAAQVVVKSCKMLPVMVVGALVHGVRYSAIQYLVALILCTGLVVFSFNSSPQATSRLANANLPLGLSLCLANLLLDGYTNSAEDEIHRRHLKSSGLHMMCWVNFWCFLYYTIGFFAMELLGMDHTFSGIVVFVFNHPRGRNLIMQFCWCGAFGQLFIFFTIKQYGSLVNTLVCTTRKFFSILLSVLWNGAVLLPLQWLGVFLVFAGIAWSVLLKERDRAKKALRKKNDDIAVHDKQQEQLKQNDSMVTAVQTQKTEACIRNGFISPPVT